MKKILTFLITVTFMTAAFAEYQEALNLFQENKYQEALKIVADDLTVADDMVEGSPNYKLRFLAAHIHWKLGNTDSAVSHFKRCMDINKTSVDPYIDLGLMMLELKRYDDASNIFREGMKRKEDAMLYYGLAKINLINKNWWRAKELFEKTNSLDPEIYVSYNDLGIVLMNLKKYSDANAAFSVALAIKPDSAEILNNMALSLEKLGKKDEALRYAEKALDHGKDNQAIKINHQRIKAGS
jgi:tetratricopeptide (TPR) repeat protein